MSVYSAKVVVEYYFEIDTEDYGLETEREVQDYAYYHFDDHAYSSEVYSVDVALESDGEDEEEEDGE